MKKAPPGAPPPPGGGGNGKNGDNWQGDLFDQPPRNPESRGDQIQARQAQFHRDNPRIWILFQQFTFVMINRGWKHYSSNGVFQRIRWETDEKTVSDEPVKLNDHYHAYYGRMFAVAYPEYADFFRKRRRPSAERPAYKEDIAVFNTGPAVNEEKLMQDLRDLLDATE